MSEAPERIWVEDSDVEYIRVDIHEARSKELEAALAWYEQTVRELATARFGDRLSKVVALDEDRGKKARAALVDADRMDATELEPEPSKPTLKAVQWHSLYCERSRRRT
jgi:hypothetical protein